MTTSTSVSDLIVKYNGPIRIIRLSRNRRATGLIVLWYTDKDFLTVEASIAAPKGMSQVNLLRAIYWMGTSIKGRSKRRLMQEAGREINGSYATLLRKERVVRFANRDLKA